MFNICSWNVRGLNDPSKRTLVKFGLSSSRRVVCCLQETKVESISNSFLRSFAGLHADKCNYLKATGASGGLVTCWSSRDFSCSEVLVRQFSLTVRLKHVKSGTLFYLTNVYGPPSWNGKREFCAELEDLKGECRGLWVMCGDFNLTRGMHERRGRSWCGKLMSLFSDLVSKVELLDLPIGNQCFTWSNMQGSPTLAKLDRFLISTEWDQAFPLSKVVALPRVTSDHSPILLSGWTELPPRRFRFEDAWLLRKNFCGRMVGWWSEVCGPQPSILAFTVKPRHYRRRIKE